ncbi:MAG: TIGR03435 family protein [Candidatus Acidiferrales bacterium]
MSKRNMTHRKLWKLAATVGLAALGLIATLAVHGQDKAARLTFEVASIKPSKPGTPGGGIKAMPGGQEYVAQNAPLILIISLMYKVPIRQIMGGPDWLNTDLWEIDAKADHSYNLDDLHTMFQNLLADEFKLKFHKETKEGPVYALTVDKSGLKMKVNESDQDFNIPIVGGPDAIFHGTRVPMQYLCWWLGQILQRDQRPVINMTGLDKNYDFTLAFLPDLPPNVPTENLPPGLLDRPNIFEALKQQLGLKLEAQKGPVEYYVIDHVEKPAGN